MQIAKNESKGSQGRLSRRVVGQPGCLDAIGQGAAKIVGAVRPTLGPQPRLTAIADLVVRHRRPEILDDGGTIARRIIALADPEMNAGAMLLREALWTLRKEVGDGAATAAVMFEAIFDAGRRYGAAGGDVMALRAGLERGMRLVYAGLARMAVPLEGQKAITSMAEAICYDPPLARVLGEIFDIIGEYGQLETRVGSRRHLEREYVEGAYWKSSWFSPRMITDPARQEVQVQDARILISNLEFQEADSLMPVLELVARHGVKALVVVAQSLSDRALSLLLLNQQPGKRVVFAVKAPPLYGVAPEPKWALDDLAVLTGGRVFERESGETLEHVQWEDLGYARRAWATAHHFGVVGGGGQPSRLREHIASLRLALPRQGDAFLRRLTQERLGRLMGGAALLWLGGETESDSIFRAEQAERTALALRAALRDGVGPGGGVAYLDCRPLLSLQTSNETERVAFRILSQALEAPARNIIRNAGFEPSECLARILQTGPGSGFDVRTGEVLNMCASGVVDTISVLQAALRTAVTTAGLALSVDVLVQSGRSVRKA